MSLAEQIGNIGSEFSRARSWEKRGNDEQKQRALDRALDLIDMSLASPHRLSATTELARLREIVGALAISDSSYQVSLEELEAYTMPFAMTARRTVL